jgi:acetolactate synthase-1/2/3 large subunit
MTQPDFCKIADAYGIRALRVEHKNEVELAIKEARAHPGPILVDFQIDQEENVWPMVPAGAALSETIEAPAEEMAR